MRSIARIALALALGIAGAGCDGDGDADAGPLDGGPMDRVDANAESCGDGVQNRDETDVDCGGVCGATCRPGQGCATGADCTVDVCESGTCGEASSCSDGRMGGDETDVDCGGLECAPCADGRGCLGAMDCESGACEAGSCAAAVCGDGLVNGSETCDDGGGGSPVESATCDVDCTPVACGDGVLNFVAGEACDGDGAGTGGETATCDADCTDAACGDGVVNVSAGETCDGDGAGAGGETAACDVDCTAVACGDGVLNATAGEACDDGNSDPTDRCDNACAPTGVAVTVSADATFDTDTGQLDGSLVAGWDAAAGRWVVDDLTVATGATLTVVGGAPLYVSAAGDVDVAGVIDASGGPGGDGTACNTPGGDGGRPGPGGFRGGPGGGFGLASVDGTAGFGPGGGGAATGDDAGGGGAGHENSGAAGTVDGSGVAGAGGAPYLSFVTLTGGSGGGGGSADDDAPSGIDPADDGGGGGGGGGGVVVLDALGDVSITGRIDVRGGDGGNSFCSAGRGGGGSGGTVLIFSPRTIDTATAELDLSGGAGPSSGGDGSVGQLYVGPAPSCGDGVQNQDETDVDCGGTACAGCPIRAACRVDTDCAAGDCVAGFCQAAACNDGTRNGSETDVDCGGAACLPCAAGSMCTVDADCDGTCGGGTCESCGDGVRNQDETDVDCGGATCGPCADGLACVRDADCGGTGCVSSVCVSCDDGVFNDQETGVDCGGPECAACAGGSPCRASRDCLSGACTASLCVGNATSCQEILTRYPRYVDGTYTIQPGATARDVRCDMTTDGGGWTLVGASRTTTLDDAAASYYPDLALASPSMGNPGLWDGMRAQISGNSDIRFTCRATPGPGPMTVDLSFYANDMYRSFTEGDDAASCGRTYGSMGAPAFPARRDNLSGMSLPEGDTFNCSVDSVGPIVEDFCADRGDFTVDFDDHGMDCDGSDGTDWGEDDATRKCGTAGLTDGEWHVWVR